MIYPQPLEDVEFHQHLKIRKDASQLETHMQFQKVFLILFFAFFLITPISNMTAQALGLRGLLKLETKTFAKTFVTLRVP